MPEKEMKNMQETAATSHEVATYQMTKISIASESNYSAAGALEGNAKGDRSAGSIISFDLPVRLNDTRACACVCAARLSCSRSTPLNRSRIQMQNCSTIPTRKTAATPKVWKNVQMDPGIQVRRSATSEKVGSERWPRIARAARAYSPAMALTSTLVEVS